MKSIILSTLCALALTAVAHAESTKITTVHLCCPACVKGVEKAVADIKGVTADVDKDAGTVTRASVENAVNNLDYQGITTVVKFASNGEVAQATVNLYEQKDGQIVELGDITTQK